MLKVGLFAFISEPSEDLILGMLNQEFYPKIKSTWHAVSFVL